MPDVLRLVAGSALLLVGVLLLVTGALGHAGRLRRNRWVGIRSRATLRSDAAFDRANRAGAVPAAAAGAVAAVGGGALLVGGGGVALDVVVLVVAAVGSLGLAGFAGVVGERAAGAVGAAPVPACAGACAGCDLVAGCRDQPRPTPDGAAPNRRVPDGTAPTEPGRAPER